MNPKADSPQGLLLLAPLDSFDMKMDCELEPSDVITTATTDSERSSLGVGGDSHLSEADSVCDVDHAEPYMSLGYEGDHGNSGSSNHSHSRTLTRGVQLPEEPSTGLPYTPCKDPIYNARSWWEYGGGIHDYRWDCLRERAM